MLIRPLLDGCGELHFGLLINIIEHIDYAKLDHRSPQAVMLGTRISGYFCSMFVDRCVGCCILTFFSLAPVSFAPRHLTFLTERIYFAPLTCSMFSVSIAYLLSWAIIFIHVKL